MPAPPDDYDFQFGGVADQSQVVASVHRAQREADSELPASPANR